MKKLRIFLSTGIRWLWLALVVLILDIGSKKWIITHCYIGDTMPMIPGMNISYIINSGTAFGVITGQVEWLRWFLSLIAIVIIFVLSLIMYNISHINKITNVAYALIIGGALGNLFDRIAYGAVIDFIDIYIHQLHWPIFNIADLCIFCGTIMMMIGRRSSCYIVDKSYYQKDNK